VASSAIFRNGNTSGVGMGFSKISSSGRTWH
jgi:hypothetical protein